MRLPRFGAAVTGLCLLLAFADGTGPRTFAASPPLGPLDVPAAPEQQAALDRMNGYRHLVGLAPLHLHTALNRAAVNHATYYVANYGDPALAGMGLHNEEAGKPGYTGATMEDRIRGQGYTGTWNEGISLLGDPARAVDGFMGTVSHRMAIIDPAITDIGYGGSASGRARVDVFTYGGQPPRPTPPEFVAYPANGMTGVPPLYDGNETGAPFPGASYPVGTAVTLKYTGPGTLAITLATITGPDGVALPVLSRSNYDFATRNTLVLAGQHPLQPGLRYNVQVTGTRPAGPFTQTWSFVTAGAGQTVLPPPSADPATPFNRVWSHTDWPLAAGMETRSWVWGPAPSDQLDEAYAEGASGRRRVQYYDKSRMEINDPGAPANTPWFVTNGLLVTEMVSGQMQTGNATFVGRAPAEEPVAGDTRAANPDAPSYAAMRGVASLAGNNGAPDTTGSLVTASLDRHGVTGTRGATASYGVRTGQYVPETHHNVADRFWSYLHQEGRIYDGGSLRSLPLFSWVYVSGYPISEPYWVTAEIGGKPTDVLVQLFQRRVLTYIPSFAPEWQVQMGNVGQHYHAWRYGAPAAPVAAPVISLPRALP